MVKKQGGWHGAPWAAAVVGAGVLALALWPVSGPLASERADHDQARQAMEAGHILPLQTVIQRLARERPGHLLEVELERKGTRWVYEIKLLEPNGRLVKLKLDARTGALLDESVRREATQNPSPSVAPASGAQTPAPR